MKGKKASKKALKKAAIIASRQKVKNSSAGLALAASSELPEHEKDIPDPKSDDYTKGPIDLFHEKERKKVLRSPSPTITHTKQAVFDLPESDDEREWEHRLKSVEAKLRKDYKDEDDEDEDEDTTELNNAWGKAKESFYGADIESKVFFHNKVDLEETNELLEEREAITLQKQLADQLDEADFGLDFFIAPSEPKEVETKPKTRKEVITTDVSQLSLKQKRALLNKRYPEFTNIVTDYKSSLVEYRDRLAPILHLQSCGRIPNSHAVILLREKAKILLSYCCCCQFYLLLRAENAKVEGHPVIKRMTQMKRLLKEMSNAEAKFESETEYLLRKVSNGQTDEIRVKKDEIPPSITLEMVTAVKDKRQAAIDPIEMPSMKPNQMSVSNAKSSSKRSMLRDPELLGNTNSIEMITKAEQEAYEFYKSIRMERSSKKTKLEEGVQSVTAQDEFTARLSNMEDGIEGKREITTEMMKNKGLTPSRKKTVKTSRMKNKLKYKRKMVQYRKIVPQVQMEMKRYSGEASGIRAGFIKSVPITR